MEYIINRLKYLYYKIKYSKNVWYGGSLSRETALRSVGKGWSKLINNLYDAKPKRTKVVQVKEKWGTLHFYTSHSVGWYEDLIIYYDHLSETICEQCGKPGKLRSDRGWVLTLCDECDEIDKKS